MKVYYYQRLEKEKCIRKKMESLRFYGTKETMKQHP